MTVHVAGRVRTPGVVTLPAGSRVADALDAVGGALKGADLAAVNLARPLTDGEQVLVPKLGHRAAAGPAPEPAPRAGTGSAGPAAGPVDLNAATPAQLEELPGVGPVLAERIVEWRTQHGRFSSVEELAEVAGIGETTLAELAPLVRV